MKRKIFKLLSVILTVCVALSAPLSANAEIGDITGYTKYTDIAAYINHFAIQSYNYMDTTYVVAEDLLNFGFSVEWNGAERTLNVSRDTGTNSITQCSIPHAVEKDMVGTNAMPILETDIKAYVGGELTESGNIDGKTVIPFKALSAFGKVVYDDGIRAAKLWVEDGLQMNTTMQSLLSATGDANPYNEMGYIDITGATIAEIAEENGMELQEFLEGYGLPSDMPGSTNETVAYYMMPLRTIAQMYGLDFDSLKAELGLGENVTEDTPWGVAIGELTLGQYVGAEFLDEFKAEYGFGDEVTLDTKWKDVRNTVDAASKANYAVPDDFDEDFDETEPDKSDPVHIKITLSNNREIEADLYPHIAPASVENFVKLIDEGFFDGLIFHRVIDGFMIQGGGFDQSFYKGNFNAKEADTIKGEFRSNGFANNLKHTRGVISMARTSDPNSASSQFFIMHQDAPYLDGEYAAFGEVTKGMDVVDDIATSKTTSLSGKILYMGTSYEQEAADVPEKAIVIRKIKVVK